MPDWNPDLPTEFIGDPALLQQVQRHNAEVAELQHRKAEHVAHRRDLLDKCCAENHDASTATACRLAADDEELACLREERRLWEQRRELLPHLRTEAAAALERAGEAAEKTRAATAKKMASIGITVESMPAWPKNRQAAEREFEHQLHVAPAARESRELVAAVREHHSQLAVTQGRCREAIDALNTDIRRTLSKLL